MTRTSLALCALLAVAGCATEGPANKLQKANVLPLALDDSFQFRKIQQTIFDSSKPLPATKSEAAEYERQRMAWGAIDYWDLRQRDGSYYNFFWRTKNPADVTVRFEYRQAGLGNYVMAQERNYPDARGTRKSSFQVTGDDVLEDGPITSWRVLLVVDGRIVAMRQSFMWK